MRKRQLFWIAPALAIGLSSCTTFRPPPMDTAKACADWRWIGISQPGGQCPAIPGWTVQPLFPQVGQQAKNDCKEKPYEADEGAPEPASELIGELERFCVYEASPQSAGGDPLPPPESAGLVRIDRDCAALGSSSGMPRRARLWVPHSELLTRQTGMPQETMTIDNPFGVRLAFLDTEPTRGEVPERQGRSPHGYTLAHIARHLVCQGKSCAARITTQLALPIREFDPQSRERTEVDAKRGGFIGMQSHLAQAILSEVGAWRKDRRQKRLVLNLSLAWDGELFGGLDETLVEEMRAGTQAVYRALQYASGYDVLVLAAAGNLKGEPCANYGPLLPAAWESEGPCKKSDGKPWDTAPRLYAVGGVDAKGDSLVNARPGGMPRRAAYGDNAVVACPNRRRHTAMLTGSSVATAVASSIASVVWSAFPKLTPEQVMAVLDGSGEKLDFQADFWSAASASAPPEVHRLSLCSALAKACEKHGPCVPEPSCASWRQEPRASNLPFYRAWRPGSCQPWLYPQPEVDPCPVCPPWKP